ncbi:hypothetical protein L484_005283 [Morus notabilis]|uniref:LOB domain-containing protein n=1 Tax=Morus notabilis TaxID=981085 RepID=W9QIY4_9ROSA|nr:LOB domain-containing protein 6 [Morus notabilis]EXB24354.1 hypothetical protein L484_005283 [Morus notabilis]
MASSSSHSPCAACKFLRRKCTQECVFAPYFPPDQPQKFASVHKVYGASNVAKILNELTVVHREEAAISLAYEAEARLRDPVFGCVGFITILHNRLKQIQAEVHASKKELATYIGPQAMMVMMPPPPSYGMAPPPPPTLGIQPTNNASAQLLIREPMNAQQYHHHQQQMFNSGFDHVPPVSGGFSNQMNGGGRGSPSGGVVSPSLGLGGFDNVPNYHIQSQQQQVHPPPLDYQLQTQLIISSQQKSEGDHQQN